jgi:hypothetical protein
MHSLMDAGVVDEVRILVCPASRGKGTRIFEDRRDLQLVEATGFENGVVLLRYEINKQAESPVGPFARFLRLSKKCIAEAATSPPSNGLLKVWIDTPSSPRPPRPRFGRASCSVSRPTPGC